LEDTKITVTRGGVYYEFPTQAAADAFTNAYDSVEAAAASEWQKRSIAVLRSAEKLLNEGQALTALFEDNDLLTLIQATPDGQNVPGMTISARRAIEIGDLMVNLLAWVSQQLETELPNPPTRRRVITQR
jgi:hypothetical protein